MAGRSQRAQIHHCDVCMHEVVPFAQERLSGRNRERVRKAVAIIQTCAMPPLSESAERAARHLAVFDGNWNKFDARPADEVIQVAQSFGAVSRLDDDGDLEEGGNGHEARISGLDGFDEGTPFGLASQDGNESGRVDHHLVLARQAVLVVTENLVRRSGIEDGEVSAVLRNGLELVRQPPARALAPHAGEAIAEGLRNCFGLGFAGLSGQLGREAFRFGATDVQGHVNTCRRLATV
jgi:hypothetical protein